MDILQNLSAILGQAAGAGATPQRQAPGASAGAADSLGGLGALLNPTVLSGLVGSLFANKGGMPSNHGAAAGGAGLGGLGDLLSSFLGGGDAPAAMQRQSDALRQSVPQYASPVRSNPRDRVARIIRAMVFAARADGHIDQAEQQAIAAQLQKANAGPEAQALLQQAMSDPLNPRLVADGVSDSDEALRLYAISSAVINVDAPQERQYLDSLAAALNLPAEVKRAIEIKLG